MKPEAAGAVPTCWTCKNALFGAVTYCVIYSEVIDSEVLAGADCPVYTPVEELT